MTNEERRATLQVTLLPLGASCDPVLSMLPWQEWIPTGRGIMARKPSKIVVA
jgi:hypothetical protein